MLSIVKKYKEAMKTIALLRKENYFYIGQIQKFEMENRTLKRRISKYEK